MYSENVPKEISKNALAKQKESNAEPLILYSENFSLGEMFRLELAENSFANYITSLKKEKEKTKLQSNSACRAKLT